MLDLPPPPKAPSDQLRLDAFRILSRLESIPELQSWTALVKSEAHGQESSYRLMWDCVALGAPLCVLLDLLGSPSSANGLYFDPDEPGALPADREKMFANFIQRLQLLEMQGRLAYGEVIRMEDFTGCTTTGFNKILRAIERVLSAIHESFPGLFVMPELVSSMSREDLLHDLLTTERAHLDDLTSIFAAAESLALDHLPEDASLECLVVHLPRLVGYHTNILESFEAQPSLPDEDWRSIFSPSHSTDPLHARNMGSYKSFCANYLALMDLVDAKAGSSDPSVEKDARTLRRLLPSVLTRLADYVDFLQSLLLITSPAQTAAFDSICGALFKIQDLCENVDEIGFTLRTMRSVKILQGRAYRWNGIDPAELGNLILDDLLFDASNHEQYAVFLFESMLLYCREGHDRLQKEPAPPAYPIAPWEIGPALRRTTPLDVVHAIPTEELIAVRCLGDDALEFDWKNGADTHSLLFCRLLPAQCEQWCLSLSSFVSFFYQVPSSEPSDEYEAQLRADAGAHQGRRNYKPRTWSVIGRTGPHSEASSMVQRDIHDHEFPLSPNLLPRLFYDNSDSVMPKSPLSVRSTFSYHLHPLNALVARSVLTPPPELDLNGTKASHKPGEILDLTGHIVRDGEYPAAHGGFSDVWSGFWERGPGDLIKVAVKVLRSQHIADVGQKEKLQRRMRHELNLWKGLSHKNIIPLLGTTTDFGQWKAMVCPWYENGSVSSYMEHFGDILSMPDRLQLLCEVAHGLAYLHENSVVHGDLSGSNILINDAGEACLCDFGLSSIIAEFQGTSFWSTGGLGGAIRWADIRLFRMFGGCDEDNEPVQALTPASDIYSFGSVMLEVLSGRVPYHYIRMDAQVVIELSQGKKPRRPVAAFVSDDQWAFIQGCWSDDPASRPLSADVCSAMQSFYRASREHRRNTT